MLDAALFGDGYAEPVPRNVTDIGGGMASSVLVSKHGQVRVRI